MTNEESPRFGTILCAIDVNRADEEAGVLRMAHRLAELDGAQLDVITVMPDIGSLMVGAYLESHQVKTARDGASKALNTAVEKIVGSKANKSIRHIVAVGTAYEEVLKAARVSQADLIVIGASRPDLTVFLLGPNAARVVRHAPCSVYVVR